MAAYDINEMPSGINEFATSMINNNVSTILRTSLLNTISQLEDRTITFSSDGGIFAESYVDTDGRLDSIDSTNTDALIFYTGAGNSINGELTLTYETKFRPGYDDEASGDTTHDPDSVTNPANFFDGNDSTYADSSPGGASNSLGKTFTSKYVYAVKYKAMLRHNASTVSGTIKLQTYNGSTWDDEVTDTATSESNGYAVNKRVILDKTVQGVRVAIDGDSTDQCRWFTLEYGDVNDSEIVHDIPSGTFSATFKNGFATAKLVDWESGANVQYKFTNATEDSGYDSFNTVLSSSAAFTSEPTKFWVKLVPKTTSPTAGTPSVSGVACVGDR